MLQPNHTARCFSKAASDYSNCARVQKRAAEALLARLHHSRAVARAYPRLVDLGCGPHQNHPALAPYCSQYVGFDLSLLMLQQGGQTSVCCDMDKLPLQDASVDLIFSNFAIQWSACTESLLLQMHQALRAKGKVLLSTVLDGSLNEIATAWQGVDSCHHVNHFMSFDELKTYALQAGFSINWQRQTTLIDSYPSALAAVRSVKNIGGNDVRGNNKRQGLLGKAGYTKLLASYPRSNSGFDVSYEVGFLELSK
ncbi:methyltransferase domain-containing protein [Pseudoalteromonas 'SMAR']|uniref:methyltransferase domain-containing protein n=1 Tax=Pseudoalteromonas 'SMAR' TaxID=3416908 RepID=UPI003AF28F9E